MRPNFLRRLMLLLFGRCGLLELHKAGSLKSGGSGHLVFMSRQRQLRIDMGGGVEKRKGVPKCTRERTLLKNIWTPSRKRILSAQLWIFVLGKKTEQRPPRKVENVPDATGPKHLLGGVSFVRFSSPLFFHPLKAFFETRARTEQGLIFSVAMPPDRFSL